MDIHLFYVYLFVCVCVGHVVWLFYHDKAKFVWANFAESELFAKINATLCVGIMEIERVRERGSENESEWIEVIFSDEYQQTLS